MRHCTSCAAYLQPGPSLGLRKGFSPCPSASPIWWPLAESYWQESLLHKQRDQRPTRPPVRGNQGLATSWGELYFANVQKEPLQTAGTGRFNLNGQAYAQTKIYISTRPSHPGSIGLGIRQMWDQIPGWNSPCPSGSCFSYLQWDNYLVVCF